MGRIIDSRLFMMGYWAVMVLALAACGAPEAPVALPTPIDAVIASAVATTEPPSAAAMATAAPPPTPTALATTPANVPPPEDADFELGEALPDTASAAATIVIDEQGFRELMWEDMVPTGFRPQDIMAKYQDELSQMQDGDPAAMTLYARMQEEFMNAPINPELNEVKVKIPGFIAPLEYQDDLITEFLLVPYFGACIHVPPPPANQTVHITTAEGSGISTKDAYNPVWVAGSLLTDGETTEIGVAGYRIQNAVVTPYDYDSPEG